MAGKYVPRAQYNEVVRSRASMAKELQELIAHRCIYPDCGNSRRTRGLCHGHYQTMRAYVRDGKSTEVDLAKRGLLMPPGEGGGSVNGHDAFKLGSDKRGDAS